MFRKDRARSTRVLNDGADQPLVVSAEFDALIDSVLGRALQAGHAAWLQADLEVVRGVHLLAAAEELSPTAGGGTRTGLWGGVSWFVVSHLDVRADWIRRSGTNTFLIQLNGYL